MGKFLQNLDFNFTNTHTQTVRLDGSMQRMNMQVENSFIRATQNICVDSAFPTCVYIIFSYSCRARVTCLFMQRDCTL